MKLKSLSFSKFFRQILLSTFFLVFIASCDPGVEYSHVIQNDSDFEVNVLNGAGRWYWEGADTIHLSPDTIVISKKSSKTIYTSDGIGTVYDFVNCDFQWDSVPMLVYLNDTIKIIPNINAMEGWDFRIIKEYKNEGGVCECRMVLTNDLLTE